VQQPAARASAANDDGGGNLTSLVSLNLAAGQQIAIVVDGNGSNSGDYTLNITAP